MLKPYIIKTATILLSYPLLAAADVAPMFTAVQPDTFGDSMALSNAWGDYDNDGDLDLVISFKTGDIRLYQNSDGVFENVGPSLGLPTSGKETRSIAWGDYNGDGYLDIYIGSNRNGNELYRNNAGQSFTEVGVSLGVDIPHVSSRQISWIDYDSDGDVDLFVADRVGENYLFRNDDALFTDVSKVTGLNDARPTVGACWFDYDGDGLLDLFLANQSGSKDALYKNNGGVFEDLADALGVGGDERTPRQGGVDCTVGDFDNDGDFDLFVANYGRNYLYRNDGNGGFEEVSEALGISGDDLMVGASFGDYNNDGFIDLYVAGYDGPADNRRPVDRLFKGDGASFYEIDISNSPLNGADHGVQWGDYDLDGDLDISLTEGYNILGHHPLLRNELVDEVKVRSLQVTVLDRNGLPSRAGAEVRLYDNEGSLLASRLVATGDGYNSHSNMPVHFGLKTLQQVTVEVTFQTPSGPVKQRLNDVDPSQYISTTLTVKQE